MVFQLVVEPTVIAPVPEVASVLIFDEVVASALSSTINSLPEADCAKTPTWAELSVNPRTPLDVSPRLPAEIRYIPVVASEVNVIDGAPADPEIAFSAAVIPA